jgi:microcystin-dependent protein
LNAQWTDGTGGATGAKSDAMGLSVGDQPHPNMQPSQVVNYIIKQ